MTFLDVVDSLWSGRRVENVVVRIGAEHLEPRISSARQGEPFQDAASLRVVVGHAWAFGGAILAIEPDVAHPRQGMNSGAVRLDRQCTAHAQDWTQTFALAIRMPATSG